MVDKEKCTIYPIADIREPNASRPDCALRAVSALDFSFADGCAAQNRKLQKTKEDINNNEQH